MSLTSKENKTKKGEKANAKNNKEIVVKPIYDCRYIENFKFHTCCLKRCKNYSETVSSKCLAIERVESTSDKPISDAELLHYKMKSEGVQLRMVSIRRKEAVDRVKSTFILEKFIQYIDQNFEPHADFKNRAIFEELEDKLPLRSKMLKFEHWMWFYFTAETYLKFSDILKGETSSYGIDNLLWLNKSQSKRLFNDGNTLF
jgi:hypothetical protein